MFHSKRLQSEELAVPNFPCLMRGRNSKNRVILFESNGRGMVVSCEAEDTVKQGFIYNDLNMECYQPYYGTVELKNAR